MALTTCRRWPLRLSWCKTRRSNRSNRYSPPLRRPLQMQRWARAAKSVLRSRSSFYLQTPRSRPNHHEKRLNHLHSSQLHCLHRAPMWPRHPLRASQPGRRDPRDTSCPTSRFRRCPTRNFYPALVHPSSRPNHRTCTTAPSLLYAPRTMPSPSEWALRRRSA